MIARLAVAAILIAGRVALAQPYLVADGDCGTVTLHVKGNSADPSSARLSLPTRRLLVTPVVDPGALSFSAEVTENSGVVMAAIDFKPIIAGDETRTEHAKAFIFCGAAPKVDWQRSAELALEVYPQGWNGPRPSMKVDDPMRFIAVDQPTNHLLRGIPIQLFATGGGLIANGTPADFGVNFPFQKPGRYTVVATYRRRDPGNDARWLVDISTLTFDIK